MWAYTSSQLVFTVRLHISNPAKRFTVLKEFKQILQLRYPKIKYSTVEIVADEK